MHISFILLFIFVVHIGLIGNYVVVAQDRLHDDLIRLEILDKRIQSDEDELKNHLSPIPTLNCDGLSCFHNSSLTHLRATEKWAPLPGVHSDPEAKFYKSDWKTCPLAEKKFGAKCNPAPCGDRRPWNHSNPWNNKLPKVTDDGHTSVRDLIEASLRLAWGPKPPRMDIIIRAGCEGAEELQWLYETLEYFWPSFLGDIVVVLDEGDQSAIDALAPKFGDTKHTWRFLYEEVPCMPGRVFNQVSYLNSDRYSDADYLVAIDSDCVFFSPVTPDLLFAPDGRLLLASSSKFQYDMWKEYTEFFTGNGTYQWHVMVTQPIAFARASLVAYRRWYEERGSCYLDRVQEFLDSHESYNHFCWMCQLGTFMDATGQTLNAYRLCDLDRPAKNPYQRFCLHVTYEGDRRMTYGKRAEALVFGGLCRALGNSQLAVSPLARWCDSLPALDSDLLLVEYVTFNYSYGLDFHSPSNARRLSDHLKYIASLIARAQRMLKSEPNKKIK